MDSGHDRVFRFVHWICWLLRSREMRKSNELGIDDHAGSECSDDSVSGVRTVASGEILI